MRENGFDIELRRSILKYLEAGHGYKKIAKDFGISVYTAKYIRDIYRRGDFSYFDGVDTRTRYDDSEKLAIVHLFLNSGMELKTFAREEGINPNSLRNWVRKYQEDPQHSFDGNHKRLTLKISEKVALTKRFLNSRLELKAFAQKSGVDPLTLKRWVPIYGGEAHHNCDGQNKNVRCENSKKVELVEEFLASGQLLSSFAKTKGINPYTFKSWVRKYQEGTLKK